MAAKVGLRDIPASGSVSAEYFSTKSSTRRNTGVKWDRQIAGLALPNRLAPLWLLACVAKITSKSRQIGAAAFRLSREHFLAVADQAVASGTSFLTTLSIARWSDSGQLGIYAVGISFLLSFVAFQDCLILQPYIIRQHHTLKAADEHAGSSLLLSVIFSAASMILLAMGGIAFSQLGGAPQLAIIIWCMAAIMPFALARDFARRFLFARLEFGRALLLDSAVALVQLSILGWLGASGHMSALTASAAFGTATSLAVAGWLLVNWKEFHISPRDARLTLKQTWRLGRWLVAGRITTQVQGFVVYSIAMGVAGASATGVYAACSSIVAFANPLLLGLSNVLMPRLALAWKHGGGPGLWREAAHSMLVIAALMGPLTLMLVSMGDIILRILYHAKEFEGQGHLLAVLAMATFLGSLGLPASNALAVMERPRAIVTVGAFAGLLTLALVWILIEESSLLGAAYGLLVGAVTGAAGRWIAFFMVVPHSCNSACVMRVLERFTEHSGNDQWVINRIGEGGDAEVFEAKTARGERIWSTYDSLVIKIFKPQVTSTLEKITHEKVRAQFNALSNLYAAFDGKRINGWSISVSRPLYVCKSPLALVATAVSGNDIDSCVSECELPEAARAFAMLMKQCWSIGRPHGDLSFQNILLDFNTKTISLVDAEPLHVIVEHSNEFQALAATDLAHFFWHLATDVTDLIGSHTVRRGREMFADVFLLSILESIEGRQERYKLMKEISDRAEKYLVDHLSVSWSVKGTWNRVLRPIATQRIRSLFERLESQLNIGSEQSETFDCILQSHRMR